MSSSRYTFAFISTFCFSYEYIISFPLYLFSEVSFSISMCALEIYLLVVTLFPKELSLILIVEHILTVRGGEAGGGEST
jgi:hypothetical protein